MVSVWVTVVDDMGLRSEEASSSQLKMLVVSIGPLCRVSNVDMDSAYSVVGFQCG